MRRIRDITALIFATALIAGMPNMAWSTDASLPQTNMPGFAMTEWDITIAVPPECLATGISI